MVLAVSASVRRLSSSSLEATSSSISSKGWYSGFEFLLSESASSSPERTLDFVLARRMGSCRCFYRERRGRTSTSRAEDPKFLVQRTSGCHRRRHGYSTCGRRPREATEVTATAKAADHLRGRSPSSSTSASSSSVFGLASAGGYPQRFGNGRPSCGWR